MSYARKQRDQQKELRTAKYHQRVVELKTAYKRKPKHRKDYE